MNYIWSGKREATEGREQKIETVCFDLLVQYSSMTCVRTLICHQEQSLLWNCLHSMLFCCAHRLALLPTVWLINHLSWVSIWYYARPARSSTCEYSHALLRFYVFSVFLWNTSKAILCTPFLVLLSLLTSSNFKSARIRANQQLQIDKQQRAATLVAPAFACCNP